MEEGKRVKQLHAPPIMQINRGRLKAAINDKRAGDDTDPSPAP